MKRALAFVGIAAAFLLTWVVMGYGPSSPHVGMDRGFKSLEDAGLFGDSFGYVNSFFSAVASVGVAAALLLQLHALGETKRDQEELRKAAVMQADSLFLANFFELERHLLTERHELEVLRSKSYPASEQRMHDREVRQLQELMTRSQRAYDLMQPHAEAVMNKLGTIRDGDGLRAHVVKGDYRPK